MTIQEVTTMSAEIRDDGRRRFIDAVASQWQVRGGAPMEGRVLAFLMLAEGAVSSGELAAGLGISQGTVSSSTRALVAASVIQRVWVARDRSHYFTAGEDPFGTTLRAGVPEVVAWQQALTPDDELAQELSTAARLRLRNAVAYYSWIHGRSLELAEEWEAYKADLPELDDGS